MKMEVSDCIVAPARKVTTLCNRPFPTCSKPLFQSEATCKAIELKMIFILTQIKLIFTRKVLHLALF